MWVHGPTSRATVVVSWSWGVGAGAAGGVGGVNLHCRRLSGSRKAPYWALLLNRAARALVAMTVSVRSQSSRVRLWTSRVGASGMTTRLVAGVKRRALVGRLS